MTNRRYVTSYYSKRTECRFEWRVEANDRDVTLRFDASNRNRRLGLRGVRGEGVANLYIIHFLVR
jgi:hypothetical protein